MSFLFCNMQYGCFLHLRACGFRYRGALPGLLKNSVCVRHTPPQLVRSLGKKTCTCPVACVYCLWFALKSAGTRIPDVYTVLIVCGRYMWNQALNTPHKAAHVR